MLSPATKAMIVQQICTALIVFVRKKPARSMHNAVSTRFVMSKRSVVSVQHSQPGAAMMIEIVVQEKSVLKGPVVSFKSRPAILPAKAMSSVYEGPVRKRRWSRSAKPQKNVQPTSNVRVESVF
jgi:hypothetical protein